MLSLIIKFVDGLRLCPLFKFWQAFLHCTYGVPAMYYLCIYNTLFLFYQFLNVQFSMHFEVQQFNMNFCFFLRTSSAELLYIYLLIPFFVFLRQFYAMFLFNFRIALRKMRGLYLPFWIKVWLGMSAVGPKISRFLVYCKLFRLFVQWMWHIRYLVNICYKGNNNPQLCLGPASLRGGSLESWFRLCEYF